MNQPSKISDWEERFDNIFGRLISEKITDKNDNLVRCSEGVKMFIGQVLSTQRTEVLEEVANNIQEIIEKSKATFFVNKDSKDIIIPIDEALYELKVTISDNIGMYFYEKLNQLKNKEK